MSTRCHVLLAVALVGLVVPTGVTSVGGAAGATDAAGDTQVDGVNVLRTHPSTDLGTFDDVVNASSAETLERSEVAVPGDVLVVRLDQAGLGQSIGNATGETATERFRSWLEREDTSLSFAPTDGSGPTLDSNGAGVTLRSGFAYGDNRTYLVVQTGVAMADDRTLSALSGLNYRFSAQDGNATVQSDPVSFVEPSVRLLEPEPTDGTLQLSRPTVDVLARSSLPPGTPLTVSLAGDEGVAATGTVALRPPGPQLPDRFTRLDTDLDTSSAPRSSRLVFEFANDSYPFPTRVATFDASVSGAPLNGTLVLETARARGDLFDDLTNASAVRAARERGHLVRSRLPVDGELTDGAFVRGDLLVVRLESERLDALLRGRPEDTATERFRSYLHDSPHTLRILQTPDTTSPQRQKKAVRVRQSRFRVVADGDTRWVLLDTGNLSVTYGVDEDALAAPSVDAGEAYDVSLGFPDEERIQETARDRVTVAEPFLGFGDPDGADQFFSEPDGRADVSVRSTLAPGQEVTVTLDGHTAGERYRQTVALSGRNLTRAVATFDVPRSVGGETHGVGLFVGRPSGTERRLPEAAVARTTLTFDEPTARLLISERAQASVLLTGELSRGGVLVMETLDGEQTLDTDILNPGQFESRLTLPPSVTERTAIRVVAYRSREGIEEGERLYRDGAGDPVAVTLTLDPSATPELTHTPETPPPTAMPTDDEVPEPGTTVAADATGGDGAGFGLLTSLAALSGLAWLARRR
jgi:hypothetical protein